MQPLQREKLFANHELLTLLWPLIIEQTLSVLVGMADTVMVSSVGEAAISGVSLVDMINQLIITVFAALWIPASSWEPKSPSRPPAVPDSWWG